MNQAFFRINCALFICEMRYSGIVQDCQMAEISTMEIFLTAAVSSAIRIDFHLTVSGYCLTNYLSCAIIQRDLAQRFWWLLVYFKNRNFWNFQFFNFGLNLMKSSTAVLILPARSNLVSIGSSTDIIEDLLPNFGWTESNDIANFPTDFRTVTFFWFSKTV